MGEEENYNMGQDEYKNEDLEYEGTTYNSKQSEDKVEEMEIPDEDYKMEKERKKTEKLESQIRKLEEKLVNLEIMHNRLLEVLTASFEDAECIHQRSFYGIDDCKVEESK